MDIGTLIGIVSGLGLIGGAILYGGNLVAFLDVPSIFIVFGGTVAATLVAHRGRKVIGAMGIAAKAFLNRERSLAATSRFMEQLTTLVRKNTIVALDGARVDDPFTRKALRLAVDGLPAATVRHVLTQEMVELQGRHEAGQQVFRFMGGTAPAMGMLGTLIGLVQMLRTLNDPASIGPSMAVALLTTLYGAILAYLIFNPIADKLKLKTDQETKHMLLVIEGIEAVIAGENPHILRERLDAFVAPSARPKTAS